MSTLGAILERFDAPGLEGGEDAHSQQIKAAAYAAGFAAGEAAVAAQEKADTELLEHLKAALDKALSGLSQELNAQLAAALSSIIQKTFPAISEKGFAEEFAASVRKHAVFSDGVKLAVRAAPGRIQTIDAAFANFENRDFISIEEDSALPDTAAVAEWKDAGFEFNAQAMIDEIVSALEQCVSQPANGKST